MALPTSSEKITIRLADRMLIEGDFVTEIDVTFFLITEREYSSLWGDMQTGVYLATLNPDTGDTVQFAIVINKVTGFQQDCIDRLARAYGYLYTTGLYNASAGKSFSGVSWPLTDRVVENDGAPVDTFRPKGFGGAFRLYNPDLFAGVDISIPAFWYEPIPE